MKKNYVANTEEEVKKDAKAWIIFGSIYTPISFGIFIIFPIVAQVKDLGVCLALGAFLVLLGPVAIFYGVQKKKEAERLEQQIATQKPVKNPNAFIAFWGKLGIPPYAEYVRSGGVGGRRFF